MKLNQLLQTPSGNYYGKRIVAKLLREAKIRLKDISGGDVPSFLVTINDVEDDYGKRCTIVDAGTIDTSKIEKNDSLVYIAKLGGKYQVAIKDNGYLVNDGASSNFRPISKL